MALSLMMHWQNIFKTLALIIGLVTSLYGVIGAIGAERLRRFVGFMVLSSIGQYSLQFPCSIPKHGQQHYII
jgi:formate hydrogenlyase subunit 3/multisubunit Na+/H+ antiporter MnhD subunit